MACGLLLGDDILVNEWDIFLNWPAEHPHTVTLEVTGRPQIM